MKVLLGAYLIMILYGTFFGSIKIRGKEESDTIKRFVVMVLLGWIPVAIIGLPILGIVYLITG